MNNTNTIWPIYLTGTMIMPEYINGALLILAMYGMFHGVEILHPIYSVLFLYITVGLCQTLFNLLVFNLVEASLFIRVVNATNCCYFIFHCIAWSVTSILRYTFILHNDWVDKKFENLRRLSAFSVLVVLVWSTALVVPVVAYTIHLGKY